MLIVNSSSLITAAQCIQMNWPSIVCFSALVSMVLLNFYSWVRVSSKRTIFAESDSVGAFPHREIIVPSAGSLGSPAAPLGEVRWDKLTKTDDKKSAGGVQQPWTSDLLSLTSLLKSVCPSLSQQFTTLQEYLWLHLLFMQLNCIWYVHRFGLHSFNID